MKIFKFIIVFFALILTFSCNNTTVEGDITEDYAKLFPTKNPPKPNLEPGVVFNAFPQEVGQLGIDTTQINYNPLEKRTYSIYFDIYTNLRRYAQDRTNLTKLIFQYLNEKGQLVTDTLHDGTDQLKGKYSYGPEKTVELTLHSGDLAYFAVFISPYGSASYNAEMDVTDEGQDGIEIPALVTEYSENLESFHITKRGTEYIIHSKAVILP